MADLYGRCSSCGHVFLVAKLPMEVSKAARLMSRAACAHCGETKGITVSPPPKAEVAAE